MKSISDVLKFLYENNREDLAQVVLNHTKQPVIRPIVPYVPPTNPWNPYKITYIGGTRTGAI